MQTISLNELAELPHGTFFLVLNAPANEAVVFDNMSDAMIAAGYPWDDVPPSPHAGVATLADQFREQFVEDDGPHFEPFPIIPLSRDMVQAIKGGHGNEARGRLERMTALVKDVWDNHEMDPEYFANMTNLDIATDMIAYNDDIATNGIDTGNMGADYEALAKEVAGILEGIRNVSNEQGTGGAKTSEGDQGATASA